MMKLWQFWSKVLVQVESGADIIALSDMMDGRVKFIRKALEDHNFQNIMILSYAAKYASNLYGPSEMPLVLK